jgi:hypothetical protein
MQENNTPHALRQVSLEESRFAIKISEGNFSTDELPIMPSTINSIADHVDKGVVPIIIHGEPRRSPGGVTFPVWSAAQNRVVRYAESADAETAIEAVERTAEAFTTWKAQSAAFRRRVIFQTRKNVERHKQEIIDSLMEETSCTQAWGEANIDSTLSVLDEIACSITAVSGEIPDNEDTSKLSLVFQVPVGPVLAIAPLVSLSPDLFHDVR